MDADCRQKATGDVTDIFTDDFKLVLVPEGLGNFEFKRSPGTEVFADYLLVDFDGSFGGGLFDAHPHSFCGSFKSHFLKLYTL